MTVKALRKQLMAAIAMVVVATVALSSSTYAWFVNNNSVTADGISVNATADDSLLISKKGENIWKSTETVNISSTEMKPSTSYDGKTFAHLASSVKVESAGSAEATWTDGIFKSTDLVKVTDSGRYYIEGEYDLKAVGSDAEVYVENINLSNTNDIFKSVRVAITIDGKTKVYNAGNGSNLPAGVGKTTDTGSTWTLETITYNTMSDGDIWTFRADTVYTANVKIWFEGQDVNCKTNNIVTGAEAFTIRYTKK